jgi:hypothetical protein
MHPFNVREKIENLHLVQHCNFCLLIVARSCDMSIVRFMSTMFDNLGDFRGGELNHLRPILFCRCDILYFVEV